jgi:hypothetical protein
VSKIKTYSLQAMQNSNNRFSNLLPVEEKLWSNDQTYYENSFLDELSDSEICEKYNSQKFRLLTELNREYLPLFSQSIESLRGKQLKFYQTCQRKQQWNPIKKSQLIESFLANIPVPPIILYQLNSDEYEVIDGQQRIMAIHDFYANQLTLTGLELWPELNGLCYDNLPFIIRLAVDKRAISSIVIIAESTGNVEQDMLLKQVTFDNINTGAASLSSQEVRNRLDQSSFNELLIELSDNEQFRQSLGIEDDEDSFYEKMEDVELILRFFALRSFDYFQADTKSFLTSYMIKMKENNLSCEEINSLKTVFNETLTLACNLYGEKPFQPPSRDYCETFCKSYYDAVMIGLSYNLERSSELLDRRDRVLEATQQLFSQPDSHIFISNNEDNRDDICQRISRFDTLIKNVVGT